MRWRSRWRSAGSSTGTKPTASGLIIGTTVVTCLVLEGSIYASMSPGSALLLAAAPAGAWISCIDAVQEPRGELSSRLRARLPMLVPVGLAVAWALGIVMTT